MSGSGDLHGWVLDGLRAGFVLFAGLVAARLLATAAGRVAARFGDEHARQIARRVAFWGLATLVVATALHQLGFQLGVLLGAAGIASVALGFASQTSASNVISGLFLVSERPFRIGDVVDVAGLTGEVISIDLLSVKLRTFDNIFVRIPNETIIKSQLRNLSRFPIRRFDLQVTLEFGTDLEEVERIFKDEVCANEPTALVEPAPIVIAQGFSEVGLTVQLSVWGQRTDFLALRNAIQRAVATRFGDAGIAFALPKRILRQGTQAPG